MRTLDDIIPPSRRKELPVNDRPMVDIGGPQARPPVRPPRPARFPFVTLLIALLVVVISVGALFYFSDAKVEITPNTVSAAIQSPFTASQSTGDLPFEIVTAKKVATQSVQGSGTKTVNTPATGTITVYNTQSKAQKLIATTRFATPAGLIFRIHSAVTVPAGSASKPGSVNATVTADQNGDTYNVGPTSFTVPGLAGTPQENAVYARSSTAMSGGASGTVPVIDSATEASTKSALSTALAPDLATSIQSQVPEGYVLLPGASVTTYEELSPTPSATTGMVDVREQGTVTAVVFPSAALAQAMAASVTGMDYQNEPVTLAGTDGLTFKSDAGIPDPGADSLSFTISGTASFIYTVSPSRIASAVAGKSRSEAKVALTNYPEVKRATLVLRPFWRQTFPADPTSIKVTVGAP